MFSRRLFLLIPVIIGILYSCAPDDPTPSPSDPRTAFIGHWNVNETETRLNYEVDIIKDPSSANRAVFIENFANAGPTSNPAIAYVDGNIITLDVNVEIGDGWKVNGSGVLSQSQIVWDYTLDDGATLHHLHATYTRP